MLGNCEKMVVISSTATNDWPQSNQIDDQNKGLLMASTGGNNNNNNSINSNSNRVMEKPAASHQDLQQALKCPRCDSSNTKFCYYNNYSLSQPRHFCKACKRYWTRGGTLRNVPVGGGCRKNKRLKRPPPPPLPPSSSSVDAPSLTTPPSRSQIDLSAATASSNHVAPLFYGLPTTASDLSLPFPRFNSRASDEDTVSGYDLGLGFSSSGMIMTANDGPAPNPAKHIQDLVASSSFLSGYSFFGSSCTSSASLINSGQQQQSAKFVHHDQLKDQSRGGSHFQNLLAPYDQDLQLSAAAAAAGGGNNSMATKQVKSELQAHNSTALEWMNSVVPCQNQIEQIGSSDPSLYWNLTSLGAGAGSGWPDLPNMGSSVPSLI